MNIEEVSQYFGTLHRACIQLGLVGQNMTKWKTHGYIPWVQQYRIAELTEGELMPDLEDPRKVKRRLKKEQEAI